MLAATALACTPAFDPEARLTKLRVLAVRAEPVNPNVGEITTLDTLVYVPPDAAGDPVTYSWSWCPELGDPSDGYRCPETDQEIQEMGAELGVTDIPPLSLGTDATATFRNPFPPAVLADLCNRGFELGASRCDQGFPIRIAVTVAQGNVRLPATTVLTLPVADGATTNLNPAFAAGGPAVTALMNGVDVPIDDQASVMLPRVIETKLHANVADSEAETFEGLDDDGQPALLRERLTLSWYVETGDVEPDSFHTGYFPGTTDLDKLLSNGWKPGERADYPRDDAQIILVLRDSRGGVGWTSGRVGLEPTP